MTMLDGKIALVTGGAHSGGLGAGIARRFAIEGATVTIADRLDSSETVATLASGVEAHTAEIVDLTDRRGVESMIARVVERYGRIDVLVNNAGTYRVADIIDSTDDDYDLQMNTNMRATFLTCRSVGRLMVENKWGRIINTASQLGKVGRRGYGLYCASKAAIILMTQALALELGDSHVTANCVCPGTMHTTFMTAADGTPADEYAARLGVDVDTAFGDYISERIPVGRLGRPSDVGAITAWLASDDAEFVTGAAINLTGGEQVFF